MTVTLQIITWVFKKFVSPKDKRLNHIRSLSDISSQEMLQRIYDLLFQAFCSSEKLFVCPFCGHDLHCHGSVPRTIKLPCGTFTISIRRVKIKGVVLTFHLTGWIGQEQLLFSFTD